MENTHVFVIIRNNSRVMTDIYFVTGTDTDAGKTVTTAALLEAAKKRNKVALGYKLVASGVEFMMEGVFNRDVLSIKKHSSYPLKYGECVCYQFDEAIAPHIAASELGVTIDTSEFDAGIDHLLEMSPDYIFIEGAGGWMLPLSERNFLSEWVCSHGYPVIMTVGARLGALNHAVMTRRCVEHMGNRLAGYVINHVIPGFNHQKENADWLINYFNDVPLLGEIPFLESIYTCDLSSYLNTDLLSSKS